MQMCPRARGSRTVTHGLQAIGFKEFVEYLAAAARCDGGHGGGGSGGGGSAGSVAAGGASADGSRSEGASADALLATAIERLKATTRRYARKQESWIRNRFERGGVPMLELDAGAAGEAWEVLVAAPALAAARDLVANGAVPIYWAPLSAATLGRGVFVCDRCGGRCGCARHPPQEQGAPGRGVAPEPRGARGDG
jgi:hypothetical protein